MPRFERAPLVERLQAMVRDRIPIVGAGAGTGISAKCEEAAGVDLIVVYNSGRYRMAGRASAAGLLAYGNANDIVKEMAGEILPVVRTTPVIAGVNGTDPFAIMPVLLRDLRDLGYSGVQNFPTIGLIDGSFRVALEESGIRFATEIDMIRAAHALDMLTTPYVFSPDEAMAMTEAGADIVVPHMGVTVGGTIGVSTSRTLEESVALIDACGEAARRVRPDVIVLAHGGPIATPEDVAFVLSRSVHCNGFYGASSMERLPVETAMTAHIRKFKERV